MKRWLLFVLCGAFWCGAAFAAPSIVLSSAVYTDDGSAVADLQAIQPWREVRFTHTVVLASGMSVFDYSGSVLTDGSSETFEGFVAGEPLTITRTMRLAPGESGILSCLVTDEDSAQSSIVTTLRAVSGARP